MSSGMTNVLASGIYTDLVRKFRDEGHRVYVIYPNERRTGRPTELIETEGINLLGVRTLNVTKTNIVEKGIGQLMLEGMLRTERKNLVVAAVREEELNDIDQVRAELEPLSAELSCRRGLSRTQAEELLGYCRQQKEAAQKKDVRTFFLSGEQFHVRLAEFSGNRYLAEMISRASAAAVRYLTNQKDPVQYLDASG